MVVKTLVLYAIMVTGAIWERDVFGRYLFAPAFFWEDVVSMGVMALHTAYLACVVFGWLNTEQQMLLALAACNTAEEPQGLANPASEYCVEQGGTVDIRQDSEGNQAGYCQFDDGSECDEWAYFRGDCAPGDFAADGFGQRKSLR